MKSPSKSPSRRDVLKVTLIGGAAAAAGAAVLPQAANASQYEVSVGELTLGAILRTYVAAPLGSTGQSSWSFSTQRTDSFGLRLNASVTLGVTQTRPPLVQGPITIGGGSSSFSYGRSLQQSLTVAYRVTSSVTYYTAPGTTPKTADDTVFIFLYKPRFRIFQVYDNGWPTGQFRYDLISFGGIFTRTARDLRRNTVLRNDIGATTADSMLGEYPLIEFDSAEALGLGLPRFYKGPNESSTTPQDRSIQYSGTFTYSEQRTSTYNVNIVESIVSVAPPGSGGFGTNSTLTIATSATQELSVQDIVTIGLLQWNSNGGLCSFYEDVVYTTQVIGFEGEGLLAFSGVVTGNDGKLVDGAVVSLETGDGTITRTTANRNGHYRLCTTKELPAGTGKLSCAGVTRIVATGKDHARVDLQGVRTADARQAS